MAWLSGWDKRIKLTLDKDQVDAALSNFPVMVYLSAASGIGDVDVSCVFDELTSDGNRKKIAFTSSDGTTELYAEIERWDDANEKAWLHVKVTSVSSSADTEVYLYYDADHADNDTYIGDTTDAVTHNVWDSDFMAVYHLHNDPNGDASGCMKDSTSNGKDATPSGSMTTADLVDAQVGKGIDFDGSNDFITMPDLFSSNPSAISLEIILKANNTSAEYRPLSYNEDGFYFSLRVNQGGTADRIQVFVKDYAGEDPVATVAYGVTSYRYVATTSIVSGNTKLYVDDNYIGQDGGVITSFDVTEDLGRIIGANRSGLTNFFPGIIDEVRISDTVRSAAWLKATYHTLWDSLVTFGSEETTDIEASISENVTTADVFTVDHAVQNVSLAENVTTDESIEGDSLYRQLDESVSLSDAIEAVIDTFALEMAEDVTQDEAISAYRTTTASALAEDVTQADAISVSHEAIVSLTEDVTQAEAILVDQELNVALAEDVSQAETFVATRHITLSITETLSLYGTLKWGWGKVATDTVDLADAVENIAAWGIQESLTLQETVGTAWTGTEVVESIFMLVIHDVVGWAKTIADTIDLTETTNLSFALLLRELLDLTEDLDNNWTGTEVLESLARFIESTAIGWPKSLADTVDLADTVTPIGALLIKEFLNLTEIIAPNWTGAETVESLIRIVDAIAYGWPKSLTDTIDITDAVSPEVAILIREFLILAETLANNWTGTETVESDLSLLGLAIIQQVFNETATSAIDITDLSAYIHQMVSVAADALDFGETLASRMEFNPTVTEAVAISGLVAVLTNLQNTNLETLTLGDTAGFAWFDALTDTIALADTPAILWYCMNALTDSVELTEAALGLLQLNDTISDVIEYATTLALQQTISNTVEDTLNFGITIELDNELWECWVLNTNAFHASVYSGFSFNSYAVHNNTAYACKADGIFKLSGSQDDGSAFKAGIVLPDTYFGTTRRKKFRKAYFGLSGGVTPSLRVETDSGSKTYTITSSKANITRDMIGKQWTLKVQDFDDLDFIELVPIILAR